MSQNTYVLPEKVSLPVSSRLESQPTRKTCVLLDYQPDRCGGSIFHSSKKHSGNFQEPTENNFSIATGEKVRRVVDPGGRVIKISLLDDYQVPGFGKVVGEHERNAEETERENFKGEPPTKIIKSNLNSKVGSKGSSKIISSKLSSPAPKKMEERKEEEEKRTRDKATKKEGTEKEKENDDKRENLIKGTQNMIADLENILRDKASDPSEKNVKKEKAKPKKSSFQSKAIEEKPAVEKKKRKIDTKIVQEFIKNQKQKRIEQIKTEKKSKVEEKEAIKKKLEELRVKTLKLAAQSKKKKPSETIIKEVETITEEDVTMSLGLKQVKPKISYNESISNLKKKIPQMKPHQAKSEMEAPAEKEKSDRFEDEAKEKVEIVLPEPETEPETEPKIVEPPLIRPPEESTSLNLISSRSNLNSTLKRLAEVLHLKIEEKEKQIRSRPLLTGAKSAKGVSEESLKTVAAVPEDNPQTITVNLETIHSLKEDIRKISENFNLLHKIIAEKANLNEKKPEKKVENVPGAENNLFGPPPQKPDGIIPQWQKNILLRPHPYNVYTAFSRKMNFRTSKSSPSMTSRGSSTYAETVSNKCDSNFESLLPPFHRLRSVKSIALRNNSKSGKRTVNTIEENGHYYGSRDSVSEFSSSILDSDKSTTSGVETNQGEAFLLEPPKSRLHVEGDGKASAASSAEEVAEITGKNLRSLSLKESISSNISPVNFYEDRRSLVLVTPDVKLISTESTPKKLNNSIKNVNLLQESNSLQSRKSLESKSRQEPNNSGERKSESTIAEIIDNLSENDRIQSQSAKVQNTVQKVEEANNVRRTYFQPEMLRLQFQAELILLETFQQSLTQFLEAERMKTLSEVTKIVYEKSVNTEKPMEKEDQAVQTTFLREDTDKGGSSEEEEEDDERSVTTEINVSEEDEEEESVESEKVASSKKKVGNQVAEDGTSEISEKISEAESIYSQGEVSKAKVIREKDREVKGSETPDFGSEPNGISFQMLKRMIKDEELRSEHQLALIRLREKTLNEKVKAELTFLEMKKRALKEGAANEDQNVSAIKKRQRGILLRYQSEKEEIERLKKMHKIASEERKIMMKQQKQIQQMQLSTKDMLTRLRRREKSPRKKSPLKFKTSKSYDCHSDIREDISMDVSDSILSESFCSIRRSTGNDPEASSPNNPSEEEEPEISRRKKNGIENTISSGSEKFSRKQPSIEELLSWTKRLEERENSLKELERETMRCETSGKARIAKSTENEKTDRSMRDRSTSPFKFPEISSFAENSSCGSEAIGVKKSSTISEDIPESTCKTKMTEKTVPEMVTGNTTSSDGPKTNVSLSASKNVEYNSESFESPSSSKTSKGRLPDPRSKSVGAEGSSRSVPIKLSLSPRIQSPRRRHSSGSDDSLNLSHTETASEQSDLESRIAALHEQLRKRKLEAERLRREQKKAQKERLKVKEQSLLKQIQAYDAYIQKKKQELEQEYEHSPQAISKPAIKQPKAAEKSNLKRHESLMLNESDKIRFYPRVTGMAGETVPSQKVSESDSEISERINKDSAGESITEEIKTGDSNQDESESVKGQQTESIKEPQTESIKELQTESIKELQTESIKELQTESIKELQTESIKELQTESIKELQTESIKELQKESIKELQTESIKELQTESIKELQTESIKELQTESIKELQTESIKEQPTESIKEPQTNSNGEINMEVETISSYETSGTVKRSSSTPEESPAETNIDLEGSLSDSEDQSVSMKTTIHTPEKQDTETVESKEKTEAIEAEEESATGKESFNDNTYQSDSFESDFEEKDSTEFSHIQKGSEPSQVETDISAEAASSGIAEKKEGEEVEKSEKPEGEASFEEEMKSVAGSIFMENGKLDGSEELPEIQLKLKRERGEAISDSIISDLLTDSLKLFFARRLSVQKRSKEASKLNFEILSNSLMKEILAETIEDALKIYGRKTKSKTEEEFICGEESGKFNSDSREWIGVRESLSEPTKEAQEDEQEQQQVPAMESIQWETTSEEAKGVISLTEKEDKSIEIFSQPESNHQRNKSKVFGREWLDDDFGLSRTRREAEELRLQQLQIEQEIQQLQAQREHVPYFYLREIPNKPPPPYTPPAKPLSEIPTTEADVLAVTSLAVRMIAFGEVEPGRDFFGNTVGEHVRCYKFFLFDLAKSIVEEVVRRQEKRREMVLPWERIGETLSAFKYHGIERTSERLNEFVRKQVLLLLGFTKRVEKESLMMRCFKKKRDHVDEILVSESQEEESDWTRFDEDQVSLKNEVTLAILDDLLEESAKCLKFAFDKKMRVTK